MTVSILQTATNDNAATGGNISCTFGSAVTAGSTIVVFSSIGNNNKLLGCSDTVNGSYGTFKLNVNDTTDGEEVGVFIFPNSAAGTPTVTTTYTSNDIFRSLLAVEVGGAGVTSYGGVTGQVQNAAGTDGVTTGNVTPTGQPALLVAVSMSTGTFPGAAPAAGTGFTDNGKFWLFGGGAGNEYTRLESKRITSVSGVPATFTQVSNVLHTQLVIVVLEATSGSPGALFFGAGTTS